MRRPLGVTIIAGIFIFVGGFTSVIIFIEMIDSIRFFGPSSIGVVSIESLVGLIIFAGTPLILYSTGIGLFMAQAWSRQACLTVIPFLLFLYFVNLSVTAAYRESVLLSPSTFAVLSENPEIPLKMLLRFALLALPLMYYFRHPTVVRYFLETPRSAF